MSDMASGEIAKLSSSSTNTESVARDGCEIEALLRFSGRIGRDPLLIQASGGNTSLKRNGTLWIKASGKWLANAGQQEILIPLNLEQCLQCFEEGRPLPTNEDSLYAKRLRPSIETFMHAVLPQRFVIHVHSVDTLAWAVRADAPARIAEKLSGLRWAWIPYVPSGVPLAQEIQRVSSMRPGVDVFVLGNHGLVICGESCDAAEALLHQVQLRLRMHPRPSGKPNLRLLESISGSSSWRLPECEVLHTLGTDRGSKQILKGGVLYPCQAIFLGPALTWLSAVENVPDAKRRLDQVDASCPFIVVAGCGVLVNSKIRAAEYAVLNGFAEVVRRIETTAPLRYLTDCEVDSLLSSDGDSYRMSGDNGAHFVAQAEGLWT